MGKKMHADEEEITAEPVRRWLVEQFPDWAALPLRRTTGLRHSPGKPHDYCLQLKAGHLAAEGLYSCHDNRIA